MEMNEIDRPVRVGQQLAFISRPKSSIPIIMASSSKHRHKSKIIAYLGPSAPLPVADLPTPRDVLKQCLLIREGNVKAQRNLTNPEMAAEATPLVLAVWNRANAKLAKLPVSIAERSISKRIETKWDIMMKLVSKKGKVTARQKKKFENELDRVFNILHCNCPFLSCLESQCSNEDCDKVHISCSCPLACKIPPLELEFIRDQRAKVGTKGSLQITSVDKEETAKQIKAIERKEAEVKARKAKEEKVREEEKELQSRRDNFSDSSDDDAPDDVNVDSSYHNEHVDRSIRSETHIQNRTPMPVSSMTALRYNFSCRGAAAYG